MKLRRTVLIAVTICVVATGSVLYGGFGFADTSKTNECGSVALAACGRCGDGQCVKQCGETAQSCPKDCGGIATAAVTVACGKCGDGQCVKQCGETSTTCPKDCGIISDSREAPAPVRSDAVN